MAGDDVDIYNEFPELDTPLHRRLSNPSDEEELLSDTISLTDATDSIRQLKIETRYPGFNAEKINITTTGGEILKRYNLYLIGHEGSKPKIGIVSRQKIDTIEELQELIKNNYIPAYFDKQTDMLLLSIGETDLQHEQVHHGVREDSHRNTYLAVLLVRALAVAKGNRSTISNPTELEDKNIVSLNIFPTSEYTVIDTQKNRLSNDLLDILYKLGVSTFDDYLVRIKASNDHDELKSMLQLMFRRKMTPEILGRKLYMSFSEIYYNAYYSADCTNIVISPTVFTGVSFDYDEETGRYELYDDDDLLWRNHDVVEQIEMYSEALLQDLEIENLAVVVYRNSDGNYLYILDHNHPGAVRFHERRCNNFELGFQDAEIVAELNAKLCIDKERLRQQSEIDNNFLPLQIVFTDAKNQGLSGKVFTETDINEHTQRLSDMLNRRTQLSKNIRVTSNLDNGD